MLEWFNTDVLAQLLRDHPHWAIFGSFLTSFVESLAIIGAIMPGAVVMSVIGFLVAVSVLDGSWVYCALALGAVLGNVVSYCAGRYFCQYLRALPFFYKNPHLLSGSERFFCRHGGKSIFIGQFLGPMRAVIPLTAGMLEMSPTAFLVVAVPSAIVWSVLYTAPGFLLGALSVELPPAMMAKFAGASLLALVVLWAVVWFVQFCCVAVWRWWGSWLQSIWHRWQDGRGGSFIDSLTNWLSTVVRPDDYRQLVRISGIIVLSSLLWGLYFVVSMPGYLQFEEGLYHFVQSCRSAVLEPVMIGFTCLGDDRFLAAVWLVTGLWMLYRRYFYLAWHWAAVFLTAWGVVFALKHLIFSVRPMGMVYGLSAMSFPSGHAVFSMVIFGGLATLVIQAWPVIKNRLLVSVGVLVLLVVFSRLYLGAHWVKDLVGGTLIGGILLLSTALSYHRRPALLDARALLTAFSLIVVLIYPIYAVINWHAFNGRYRQIWPVNITNFAALVSDQTGGDLYRGQHNNLCGAPVPQYRCNRLGKVIEPFNVVLVGDLVDFGRALQCLGWQIEPVNSSLHNALQALFGTSLRNYRYLFAPLYRGNKMRMLAVKTTAQSDVMLVLQLWSAGVDLVDDRHRVWVGNVSFHQQQLPLVSKDGLLTALTRQRYLSGLHLLKIEASDLVRYGFKLFEMPALTEHDAPYEWLDWSGQRLVIRQY